MQFTLLYSYETDAGMFYIGRSEDGQFHPLLNNESFGSFHTPTQAVEDLADGQCLCPSQDVDFSSLDIPRDLDEWTDELSRSCDCGYCMDCIGYDNWVSQEIDRIMAKDD